MSKDLSVFQLFDVLQEEYIICELRVKIYPILKHKEYWKNTAQMKKEKILDIANRNSLPCIFDHKEIKKSFEQRVYGDSGLPKFYYPDKNREDFQKMWDIVNYYRPESEIKFMEGKKVKVGIIQSFDYDNKKVTIVYDENQVSFDLDKVTRIL